MREVNPVSARSLILFPVLLLVGMGLGLFASGLACNSYDLLIHDHFAQASFSNRVDVLWLVDSSNSMAQDQTNLAHSFGAFINELAAPTTGDEGEEELIELDTIADAILVYNQFLANRTQFLNYQMGITTTQSAPCADDPTAFDGCEDSTGNTGRLRGLGNSGQDVSHAPTFLVPDSETLIPDFQALVDVGIEGATEEYGMWVTALTICNSLELPFASDFEDNGSDTLWECSGTNWDLTHPWAPFCRCIPPEFEDYNVASNDGIETRFLRDNSTMVVVVVTDEGDFTPNMGANSWPWDITDCTIEDPWPAEVQDACEGAPDVICTNFCKIDIFLDFFQTIDRRVVFAVIGPGAELKTDQQGNITTEAICNDQNSSIAMLEFYLWGSELTGGLYAPINVRDENDVCVDANFDETLGDLGRLVSNLASGWHLSTVPDMGTVMVFIEGIEVPPAECRDDDEDCVPSAYHPSCTDTPSAGLNGWTYDESSQSIKFHGDCIPDFNQVVDIYYLPLSGGGRPLPF